VPSDLESKELEQVPHPQGDTSTGTSAHNSDDAELGDSQTTAATANERAAKSEADKARKLSYIFTVHPSGIVTSEDGDDVTCIVRIGTEKFDRSITIEMQCQYCKHHGITIGQARATGKLWRGASSLTSIRPGH
jgi:hypothetical protein